MGEPCPLLIWSIIYVHFKVNISKNERFLSSSFEMANTYIFATYKIVVKWGKIDYPKIKIVLFSKVLGENRSFLNMFTWKCIELVDQEKSGRGLPIWATPLPSI